MTKHYKFEVSYAKEDGILKTYKFKTMKEIQEFLGLSYGTLYNLRTGRLKCKHYTKSHLKDISIIKIDFDKTHYKKKKQPLVKKKDYYKTLEDSYTNNNQSEVISQEPAEQLSST